jgi:hypothetical protein
MVFSAGGGIAWGNPPCRAKFQGKRNTHFSSSNFLGIHLKVILDLTLEFGGSRLWRACSAM